jgi:hypothetical protein
MNGQLSIQEIGKELLAANEAFQQYCHSLSDEQFFQQPEKKWSPARQVKHLVTSTTMAGLAFTLPKFMVRIVGGKPNRESRTFDELVAKYKLKLGQGGRASGRYIPKPVPAAYGKEKLLNRFSKAMNQFAKAVCRQKEEKQLDNYIAPHPLLGKITLRELCYFTIYHTYHHLDSIKSMTGGTP